MNQTNSVEPVPLIVGVGASSGGVEAFQELVRELGDEHQFAIVFVPHLERGSEVLQAELLSLETRAKVVVAADQKKVQAGTVYMSPPGTLLAIHNGAVRLANSPGNERTAAPIDYMLQSLAEDREEQAIGVVLSGTGSDGRLGLQAITAAGGMTYAQSAESSKHDSMPRCAATSGVADHVLAPSAIAAELKKYAKVWQGKLNTTFEQELHQHIQLVIPEITKLLVEATGVNFQHCKPSTLTRRIRRRMQVLNLAQVKSYIEFLTNDRAEPQALCCELLLLTEKRQLTNEPDQKQQDTLYLSGKEIGQVGVGTQLDDVLHDEMACKTAILETALDAIVTMDQDGRILDFNPAAERTFGFTQAEVQGQLLVETILPQDFRQSHPAGLTRHLETGRGSVLGRRIELTALRRDGRLFPIELAISAATTRSDKQFFIAHMRDITERKQRELTLEFLANLQISLGGFSTAEAILGEAGQRVSDYLQLSHFLLINLDPQALQATVAFDHCSAGSDSLIGVYDMAELASEDERRQLAAGLPMVINDTAASSRSEPSSKKYAALKVGAILNTPCYRDQQLRFMLSATRPHPHPWRDDEIQLMRELGNILRLWLDRSHAESALRESEAKFRDLADNISQFAWMTDSAGAIFWYNQRWFDFTGTTLDEMRDWGWTSVQHPDHVERVLRHWKACLASGAAWEDTFPLRSRDGEYRWFLSRAQPIRNEVGSIVRWFGTNTDITAAKQAEEALRASQEQLRLGVEVAEFALARIDYVQDRIYLTREAARMYGLGADEIVVSRGEVHATFHPDDRQQLLSNIERFLDPANDSDLALLHRVLHSNGNIRLLDVRKRVTFDRSCDPPRPLHGILVAQDITESNAQEQRIRESEERLRNAAEAAGFGTVHVDLVRSTITYSQELRRLLGLPVEDEQPLPLQGLPNWVHPEDRAACAVHYRALIKLPEGSTGKIDHRIVAHDGQVRWVRLQSKPVYTGNGARRKVTQVIGTVIDITPQREFEQSLMAARREAEAANQSKSEFLANMSHEIRTPMTAILGYTDLIAEKINDAEMLMHLQTIRRNGDFLLELINDILDLSKIEAGKFEISPQLFSPQQLVEDVLSIMKVRAAGKNIDLNIEYRGQIPHQIESDPKRLRQILINLVGNAIKFTPIGNVQIRISYSDNDKKLRFDVIDSGIGISNQQRQRLFKPFSQGDGNVNREFGGTGLGLAISQRLTEMLGGQILVESELGSGSTFTVTIAIGNVSNMVMVSPQLELPLALPQSYEQASCPDFQLNCHLLVVDDRRDIRFLSRSFLTEVGATVTEAEDGEIAIAKVARALEQGPLFDLILLDMQMPNLDGYATAVALRNLGFTNPIVALTADAMQGDMSRCIESGCNEYLSKPIERTKLLNLVRRLTQK